MFVPIAGLLLTVLSSSFEVEAATGNTTTCADGAFDLYIEEVGETPCKTYERLRQICNNDYVVPTFPSSTPPDVCDEQVGDCCCNSAAWSLAMFCMNCQLGAVNNIGYDAGVGAYQWYLEGSRPAGSFCSPQVNGSLPETVQLAVCNKQIKIPEFIYGNYWGDGSWYYVYSAQKLTTNLNTGTAFDKCDYVDTTSSTVTDITSSSGTATSSPSPSQTTSDPESSSLSTGATAGIAVGASVVGLAALAGLIFFLMRRRKAKEHRVKGPIDGDWEHPSEEAINPFVMTDASVGMASLAPNRPGETRAPSNVAATATTSQSKLDRYRREDAAWNDSQDHTALGEGPASTYYPASSSNGSGSGSGTRRNETNERTVPFRHADAGPVVPEREPEEDMELPPAYGEQLGSGNSHSRSGA